MKKLLLSGLVIAGLAAATLPSMADCMGGACPIKKTYIPKKACPIVKKLDECRTFPIAIGHEVSCDPCDPCAPVKVVYDTCNVQMVNAYDECACACPVPVTGAAAPTTAASPIARPICCDPCAACPQPCECGSACPVAPCDPCKACKTCF